MKSKYRNRLKNLSDRQLSLSIASARNTVELGERRIMNLELRPEIDGAELRKNYVLLRAIIAHLKMLESEQARRSNE